MKFHHQAMWMAMAGLAVALVAGEAFAQGGPGGRGGFGGGSSLGLLNQEGIQNELELVEDQIEELNELQEEMRNEMREMFMGMRDEFQGGDRQAAFEKMREKMEEVNGKYDGRTKEILLPHQWTRLSQIRLQSESRRFGGAASGNLPPSVISELNISDDQLEKLKAKAEEVRKTMDEKIAKIRQQAEEEILSVLTADQRAQYKELVGDAYKFEDRGRFGGPGAGGPGGPGGGPGGRFGGRGGNRGGDEGGNRDDF